jgi:hypothetical protein
MLTLIARWSIPLVSLLAVGPLAASMVANLRSPDGGAHASLLVSGSPVMGVLTGIAVFAMATIMGVLGSRLISYRLGLFSAGLVLAWAAWATGRVDSMLLAARSGSLLYRLAFEGLLVGGLTIASAYAILRASRRASTTSKRLPREDVLVDEDASTPIALVACLVVAAVAAYFIAQETLKGQTVAATVAAGILGALAGRMLSAQGRGGTSATGLGGAPALVFFLPLALLASAGPALATFVQTSGGGVLGAASAGRLFPLSCPLPLDWAAGAMIGVPVGLSWARSLSQRH